MECVLIPKTYKLFYDIKLFTRTIMFPIQLRTYIIQEMIRVFKSHCNLLVKTLVPDWSRTMRDMSRIKIGGSRYYNFCEFMGNKKRLVSRMANSTRTMCKTRTLISPIIITFHNVFSTAVVWKLIKANRSLTLTFFFLSINCSCLIFP